MTTKSRKSYKQTVEYKPKKMELDEYPQFEYVLKQHFKTKKMLREMIDLAFEFEELTPREHAVIEYRFLGAHTLEETGKRFDVTRERIRQIETKALEIMERLTNK